MAKQQSKSLWRSTGKYGTTVGNQLKKYFSRSSLPGGAPKHEGMTRNLFPFRFAQVHSDSTDHQGGALLIQLGTMGLVRAQVVAWSTAEWPCLVPECMVGGQCHGMQWLWAFGDSLGVVLAHPHSVSLC